jgi:hypothetical protein
MTLTLNQIIARLRTLALSHKQVNNFYYGDPSNYLFDNDVNYPAVIVEHSNSVISKTDKQIKYGFRIYFVDMINLAQATNANRDDVLSDQVNTAMDYTAMLNYTGYQDDWTISDDYNMIFYTESQNDMVGGVSIDVVIGADYDVNRCQVPADGVTFETADDMKIVQLLKYKATGGETTTGDTGLTGKKILLTCREFMTLKPTITAPLSDEVKFTAALGDIADDGIFTFGNELQPNELIQILWRNS